MFHIAGRPTSRNSGDFQDGEAERSNVVLFRRAAKLEAGRRKLDAGVAYLEALAADVGSLPPDEILIFSNAIERLRCEVAELKAKVLARVAAQPAIDRLVELEAYRRARPPRPAS